MLNLILRVRIRTIVYFVGSVVLFLFYRKINFWQANPYFEQTFGKQTPILSKLLASKPPFWANFWQANPHFGQTFGKQTPVLGKLLASKPPFWANFWQANPYFGQTFGKQMRKSPNFFNHEAKKVRWNGVLYVFFFWLWGKFMQDFMQAHVVLLGLASYIRFYVN